MGHYTGPKARINRRLGLNVYENAGALKASERRDSPPGMHQKHPKPTAYGLALTEKQKIKHYYGLTERQLRRLFAIAKKGKGNTGVSLLLLCERRLDNVLRRAGFTKTRPQARQGIGHGHVLVNGQKVDQAAFLVKRGDIVTIKNRPELVALYTQAAIESETEAPLWLNRSPDSFRVTVASLPGVDDISLPINVSLVVELMTR
jgi:small subunit ribosomal protein S4